MNNVPELIPAWSLVPRFVQRGGDLTLMAGRARAFLPGVGAVAARLAVLICLAITSFGSPPGKLSYKLDLPVMPRPLNRSVALTISLPGLIASEQLTGRATAWAYTRVAEGSDLRNLTIPSQIGATSGKRELLIPITIKAAGEFLLEVEITAGTQRNTAVIGILADETGAWFGSGTVESPLRTKIAAQVQAEFPDQTAEAQKTRFQKRLREADWEGLSISPASRCDLPGWLPVECLARTLSRLGAPWLPPLIWVPAHRFSAPIPAGCQLRQPINWRRRFTDFGPAHFGKCHSASTCLPVWVLVSRFWW